MCGLPPTPPSGGCFANDAPGRAGEVQIWIRRPHDGPAAHVEVWRRNHRTRSARLEARNQLRGAHEAQVAGLRTLERRNSVEPDFGIALDVTSQLSSQVSEADLLGLHGDQRARRTATDEVRTTAAELLPRKYSVIRLRP